MSKHNILATVDAYIVRTMEAMSKAHSDAEYVGLCYILGQLEDFSDWLVGIHRDIY